MNIFLKTIMLICVVTVSLFSALTTLSNLNDRTHLSLYNINLTLNQNHLTAKGNDLLKNKKSLNKLDYLTKASLKLSPLNISALYQRSAWLASIGQDQKSLLIMKKAKGLSRRNRIVNFWFIQWGADNGDIDRALEHIDYALVSSKDYAPVLFSTIAKIMDIAEGRLYIANIIKKNPVWAYPALKFAILSENSADNVAETLSITNGLPPSAQSRQIEDILIYSLAAKNNIPLARRYYLSIDRAKPSILSTFGFFKDSVNEALFPITWGAVRSQYADGEIVYRTGKTGPILRASAIENNHGLVARRLFFPKLGDYQIVSDATITGSPTAQLIFSLKCAIGIETREFYREQFKNPNPMPILKIDRVCDGVYFDIELYSGEGQIESRLELRALKMEKIK